MPVALNLSVPSEIAQKCRFKFNCSRENHIGNQYLDGTPEERFYQLSSIYHLQGMLGALSVFPCEVEITASVGSLEYDISGRITCMTPEALRAIQTLRIPDELQEAVRLFASMYPKAAFTLKFTMECVITEVSAA